jgi:hypothetical protein
MKPHELAAKIKSAEVADSESEHNIEGIAKLLKAANLVYEELEAGEYQKTEHGHVRLEAIDTSDSDQRGKIVGGIIVYFVDPAGFETQLGKIEYSKGSHRTGVVTAYDSVNYEDGKLIMPSDERWEVIVDTVGFAIRDAKEARRAHQD